MQPAGQLRHTKQKQHQVVRMSVILPVRPSLLSLRAPHADAICIYPKKLQTAAVCRGSDESDFGSWLFVHLFRRNDAAGHVIYKKRERKRERRLTNVSKQCVDKPNNDPKICCPEQVCMYRRVCRCAGANAQAWKLGSKHDTGPRNHGYHQLKRTSARKKRAAPQR